jgi:hypothetical protein
MVSVANMSMIGRRRNIAKSVVIGDYRLVGIGGIVTKYPPYIRFGQ